MFRKILLSSTLCLLLVGCNQPVQPVLTRSTIPNRRQELQQELASIPLAASWDFLLPNTLLHRLYLEEDILFAETKKGWVYAIDAASGETIWTLELSDSERIRHLDYRPGLSETHVALLAGGILHLVDRRYGELTHKLVLPFAAMSSPTPVGDRVYVGGHDRFLYAFNYVKGLRDWRFATDGDILTKPLYKPPYLYFTSGDQKIYQVEEATGKQVYTLPTIGEVSTDMTADGDTVFATSRDNRVYNITTGVLQWKFFGEQEFRLSAFAAGTSVFAIDRKPTLYCIDRTSGAEKWRIDGVRQYLCHGTQHDFALQGNYWLIRIDPIDGTIDGRYDLSAFDFFLTNPRTNALYLGTRDGALFCLTEK